MEDRKENIKRFARMLRYMADCMEYCSALEDLGDCNNCGKRENCEHRPEWGAMVRINCHMWESE